MKKCDKDEKMWKYIWDNSGGISRPRKLHLLSDNVIIFNVKKKGDGDIMRSLEKEPDDKYQNKKKSHKISFLQCRQKISFFLGNLKQT